MKRLISLILFVVLLTGQYTTASCPMDLGNNHDERAELANIADAKHQSHKGHRGETSDSQADQKGHHDETACLGLMNCGTFSLISDEFGSKDLGHGTLETHVSSPGPRTSSMSGM